MLRYIAKHVFCGHATEESNLISLLQSGRFKPSTLHDSHACGFFAQGYGTSGAPEYDRSNTARVLAKTNGLDKDRAQVFLHIV